MGSLSLRAEVRGERRSASHKRLLYCVNVNRTSLDHLLLGVVADIDKVSHVASIAPGRERESVLFLRADNREQQRHKAAATPSWPGEISGARRTYLFM